MNKQSSSAGDGKAAAPEERPRPAIVVEECKACGRCLRACPGGLLEMSRDFNSRGYHYVGYKGEGCTGCGLCFYCCPEPHALRVIRPERKKKG